MSQLQLSLLGEPIVKHGEDTLTFTTCKACSSTWLWREAGPGRPRLIVNVPGVRYRFS